MTRIVQDYAIRSREFSDAVARLGKHTRVTPEFLQAVEASDARLAACNASRKQLGERISQIQRNF